MEAEVREAYGAMAGSIKYCVSYKGVTIVVADPAIECNEENWWYWMQIYDPDGTSIDVRHKGRFYSWFYDCSDYGFHLLKWEDYKNIAYYHKNGGMK